MKRYVRIAICAAIVLTYWGLAALFCSTIGFLFALVVGLVAFCIAVFILSQSW